MDINERIARRVRELRSEHGYSLDALAERSGVSRSSISLIERAQTSPTANVLDKLASALGVTLASMFEARVEEDAPPSPLARRADQPVWTDPDSGYVRRNLSPAQPSPLQFVEVQFPPGERVAYDTSVRDNEVWQQIWVIEGTIEISLGDASWRLEGFTGPKEKFWVSRSMVDNDRETTRAQLQKVHDLLQREPGLVVVPAHDAAVQERLGYYPKWVQ